MFCTKWGKKIDDNAKFCVYCGTQITLGNEIIAPQYSYAGYVGSIGCAYVTAIDDELGQYISVAAFHGSV